MYFYDKFTSPRNFGQALIYITIWEYKKRHFFKGIPTPDM